MTATTHKTAIIMAGGTGGHIFPGLAVADVLVQRGWSVKWLGNPAAMEGRLVPSHGIELLPLVFSGLRGKGALALFLAPLRLLRAFWQALLILRKVRPHAVLGMGGYVAFPGGMMASLLNIPLVIHEQNSIAGLTNKVLAKVADRTLVAFPGVLEPAPWVGNPVRASLKSLPPPERRFAQRTGPLRLLVVGGSLGAQALNQALPKALALLPEDRRPQVVHQSGKGAAVALSGVYDTLGVKAEVVEFIDDMAQAMLDADVMLCRAGAMTVSEVAVVGVAAHFVPFPFAVDDHQTTNAAFLSQYGAAWLTQQSQLTPDGLAQWLLGLSRSQLFEVATKAHAMAKPDAADVVADVIEDVATTKRSKQP